jgi:photosystem II stability/assembly factor-like uncharacterized protein
MRLCVGTAKGIVILDPERAGIPLMVLADPTGIWCMAQDCADPAVVYAGGVEHVRGKGTLSRSTDGGRSWTDITPHIAREEEVWAIAASPAVKDQVFAGTSHARLLRSDDRGRSFHEFAGFLKIPGRERWTFPPPPHIPHVRSISFDPHDPRTMYVGVEEGGVFRTRDSGASFETLNDGLYDDVHTVAVDPADSRRLYATTGRGFYTSDNAGASWRHVRNGLNRTYTVPLLVDNAETIFTAAAAGPPPTWSGSHSGADAIMFMSRDRGASFAPLAAEYASGRGMVMRLRSDPERGGFFGVTTDGRVLRAHDGGLAVALIAEKLPPAHDLVMLP